MEGKRLRNLILIPWLSVPIILASYLLLWNRIPSEIAVHFTALGDRVTLMSRTQSLLFDLITLLLLLTIGSWILLKRNINPGRILVRYYFAIVAMTIIFLAILLYNVRVHNGIQPASSAIASLQPWVQLLLPRTAWFNLTSPSDA